MAGAFDVDSIVRVRLRAATRLWKWADAAPGDTGPVSPWWLPLNPETLGLGEYFRPLTSIEPELKRRGAVPRSAYRSGVAVLPEWNALSHFIAIALREIAFGFAGPAAMQQVSDCSGRQMPIYLAGGMWQIYVPGLSAESIEICDPGEELERVGADADFWLSPFHVDSRPAPLGPKARRLMRLFGLPEE